MPLLRRPSHLGEGRRRVIARAGVGSDGRISLGQAAALGVLQGPTELLPVSSSAHTTLVPWLAGWSYPELDPELRKSFEVALHAGAAAALALDMRAELIDSRARARRPPGRRDRAVAGAAGARGVHAGAHDRAPPRRTALDRSRACSRAPWRWSWPIPERAPGGEASRCRATGRARARARAGRGSDPRRLAQRSDAHGRPRLRLRARGCADALLARRPAGDRRRKHVEDVAAAAGKRLGCSRSGARGGWRNRLPLHGAERQVAASPARERSIAAALCGLPLHDRGHRPATPAQEAEYVRMRPAVQTS